MGKNAEEDLRIIKTNNWTKNASRIGLSGRT